PTDVGATVCTQHVSESLENPGNKFDVSDIVVDSRKRSRLEFDVKTPPQSLNHGWLITGGSQAVDSRRMDEASHTQSCRALRNSLNDNPVPSAAKQASQNMAHAATPLPDEHHTAEPIKTEMQVDVFV
ncbi:unnamed protein product, partial [Laminaria digitata]